MIELINERQPYSVQAALYQLKAMRQAFFIVGFNNWGKTTIIRRLFGGRHNFSYGRQFSLQAIPSLDFTVETHSNDDLIGQRWITEITRKMQKYQPSYNFFAAL